MDSSEANSRSEKSSQLLSPGSEHTLEDDGCSVNGTESSSSSSGRIEDDVSTELKPYLEIGKQLNVRSKSSDVFTELTVRIPFPYLKCCLIGSVSTQSDPYCHWF
jgi:hypothetical protein